MEIQTILNDKAIKAKAKVQAIAGQLLEGNLTTARLISDTAKLTDVDTGTCVEALEFATRLRPELADEQCLRFAIKNLQHTAPRVKWESAKVIGNIAVLFESKLSKAISGLLINTEDAGTVVRWSAAHALSKIISLNTSHNAGLIPAIETIVKREEDNAIKKIYQTALKKSRKA